MHSAAILAKENQDLHAANERQKQNRTRSTQQIPHEGGLSIQEAHELIDVPIEMQIARTMVPSDHRTPALQPPRRKPPTCKKCGEEGHRSDHCPNRVER